jgi:tetratricopeptide (TPR) repeat protein
MSDGLSRGGKRWLSLACLAAWTLYGTPWAQAQPATQGVIQSHEDAGLASLRRSVESATDARKVVERYRQFIERYKGTPASEEAAADLGVWEDRVARGLVKLGPNWVAPEEVERIRGESTEQARQALAALDQSRLNDAEDLLKAALTADPGNAPALYLRGVLLYRQEKLPDARKAFEASLVSAPRYGPSLNNLAVTAFRMQQWTFALQQYDQALLLMPLQRGLLSNVAEAMEALPEIQKNTPLARRVKRKYDEQMAQLSQQLAQRPASEGGPLYPWGATWVNQQQMDAIRAGQDKAKDELDKVSNDIDQLARQVVTLEGQITANVNDMKRIEAECFRYDQQGNVVQFPLPQVYYTLRNQTEQLKGQRLLLLGQQEGLKKKMEDLKKAAPAGLPKFTGIQQLYAGAAAPGLVPSPPPAAIAPPAPAPVPATQP